MMGWDDILLYAYLAGTAASIAGSAQQQRQQQRILGRAMDESDKAQSKGADAVVQEAQKSATPQARQAAMQQAEDANYQRTMADVGGAGGNLVDTAQGGGNVSQAFTDAKAAREATEGDRMSAVAHELAKVRAPGDVGREDAIRRGSLAEELGSMWSSQRANSQAAQQDAQSTGMPGYGQLGGLVALASGAALGAGAGAGTGAAAANTAATNPALIESAAGTAGYGASSASPVATASPWWARTPMMASSQRPKQQPQWWAGR